MKTKDVTEKDLQKIDERVSFKPGSELNAVGKPNRIKHYCHVKKISREDLKAALQYMIELPFKELDKFAKREDTPSILVGFARALMKDLANGNTVAIRYIQDVLFGKLDENLKVKSAMTVRNFDIPLPENETREYLKTLNEVLKNVQRVDERDVTGDKD
jgi:hypothetical protein